MIAAPRRGRTWVQLHCFSEIFLRTEGVSGCGESFLCVSQTAQVSIMSLDVVRRFGGDEFLFVTAQLRLQRLRYSFGDLALDSKDVGQLSVVSVGPKMGIGLRVNQLHIDSHLIGYFLHATLKDVRDTELLRDLAEIGRFALILPRGSARNHF